MLKRWFFGEDTGEPSGTKIGSFLVAASAVIWAAFETWGSGLSPEWQTFIPALLAALGITKTGQGVRDALGRANVSRK